MVSLLLERSQRVSKGAHERVGGARRGGAHGDYVRSRDLPDGELTTRERRNQVLRSGQHRRHSTERSPAGVLEPRGGGEEGEEHGCVGVGERVYEGGGGEKKSR